MHDIVIRGGTIIDGTGGAGGSPRSAAKLDRPAARSTLGAS
jgi:hypothetical protein